MQGEAMDMVAAVLDRIQFEAQLEIQEKTIAAATAEADKLHGSLSKAFRYAVGVLGGLAIAEFLVILWLQGRCV